MKINPTWCTVCHVCMLIIAICYSIGEVDGKLKRRYIGEKRLCSLEYGRIKEFYSPEQERDSCANDSQCTGLTLVESKKANHIIPELHIFRLTNESSAYLTTEIKYTLWASYTTGLRNYNLVSGCYASNHSSYRHRFIR